MNKTIEEFFELVRSGLWGSTPRQEMFSSHVDWQTLYDYSRAQAFLGIVLDGIKRLPDNLRPPRLLYIKWCAEVLQIEDDNRKLDSEVVNLFNLFRSNDIEPILMKGQGISRNYPEPLHRSSGDIDLFIGEKNLEKANSLLLEDGESYGNWNPKHESLHWHDVTVENHWHIVWMAYPKANASLQKIVDEWYLGGKYDKVIIEGNEISVPPLDFNVVFILLHTVQHLVSGGVGLRQVCDWILLLHNRRNDIDKLEVRKILKELDLVRACRIFGALAVKYLGLPENDLIVPFTPQDEKESLVLLEDILYSGNFGCTGEKAKRKPKNWVKRRIFNFRNTVKRQFFLKRILPGSAIWYTYTFISSFIKMRIYKFKNK